MQCWQAGERRRVGQFNRIQWLACTPPAVLQLPGPPRRCCSRDFQLTLATVVRSCQQQRARELGWLTRVLHSSELQRPCIRLRTGLCAPQRCRPRPSACMCALYSRPASLGLKLNGHGWADQLLPLHWQQSRSRRILPATCRLCSAGLTQCAHTSTSTAAISPHPFARGPAGSRLDAQPALSMLTPQHAPGSVFITPF